jgi:hypothetical protein
MLFQIILAVVVIMSGFGGEKVFSYLGLPVF